MCPVQLDQFHLKLYPIGILTSNSFLWICGCKNQKKIHWAFSTVLATNSHSQSEARPCQIGHRQLQRFEPTKTARNCWKVWKCDGLVSPTRIATASQVPSVPGSWRPSQVRLAGSFSFDPQTPTAGRRAVGCSRSVQSCPAPSHFIGHGPSAPSLRLRGLDELGPDAQRDDGGMERRRRRTGGSGDPHLVAGVGWHCFKELELDWMELDWIGVGPTPWLRWDPLGRCSWRFGRLTASPPVAPSTWDMGSFCASSISRKNAG